MYRPGGRSPGGGFDKARTESDATRGNPRSRSRSRNRPSARTRRQFGTDETRGNPTGTLARA